MSSLLQILVLANSRELVDALKAELCRGNYSVVITWLDEITTLAEALENQFWHLVLTEYQTPTFTALEVLAQVQQRGLDLPILVISDVAGEEITVQMIRAGVQDYIVRPNLAQLLPAVERELRAAEQRALARQTQEQLAAVLDAVPGCISWFTHDLVYRGINRYLAESFNLPPEQFIGKEIGFLESSPSFAQFVRSFFASADESRSMEIDAVVRGTTRGYLIMAQKYNQGHSAVFVGLDITERRQMEAQLRESQERYALAMQGANDGLWDWNLRTDEIYFGYRWKQMLGYSDEEIGCHPDEWFSRIHPDEQQQVKALLFLHLGNVSSHFECEHRMMHKDGQYRWMLTRGLAVRDAKGEATRMAGSQADITDRKRYEEMLLQNAFYDSLTGLPNRALLLDRLGQVIDRSRRNDRYNFAILYLDMDRFQIVNDCLGRNIGDQLLVAIAQRLQICVRSGDTVARLGEDEFVVLMDDMGTLAEANRLAEEIRKSLRFPFQLEGNDVFTSMSIGIVVSHPRYERPEDLLQDSSLAMYRAKRNGRDRHEIFDSEMYERAIHRLRMETDLRKAIDRQEFQVYYQPLIKLSTSEVAGFEALVRWVHPDQGMISPAEFIPLAEENGLIVSLGAFVLEEACRQMRVWQESFPAAAHCTISVNLSVKQFMQSDLISQIQQILVSTGLSPQYLKLEMTESVLMSEAESAIATLRHLKDLGLHLQIDDFGTGYSCFNYLHQFPTDNIKVDQSFIRRLGTTDNSYEIVRAIISMAHNLKMTVTAEGVETEAQMHCLKDLGAEWGQGYFFARPLPPDQIVPLCTSTPPWLAAIKQTTNH